MVPLVSTANATRHRLEAFARDFRSLMGRLDGVLANRMDADGASSGRELARRATATTFQPELRQLVAQHAVGDALAEYARHVVREGFEVPFDAMDPTREALLAGE